MGHWYLLVVVEAEGEEEAKDNARCTVFPCQECCRGRDYLTYKFHGIYYIDYWDIDDIWNVKRDGFEKCFKKIMEYYNYTVEEIKDMVEKLEEYDDKASKEDEYRPKDALYLIATELPDKETYESILKKKDEAKLLYRLAHFIYNETYDLFTIHYYDTINETWRINSKLLEKMIKEPENIWLVLIDIHS